MSDQATEPASGEEEPVVLEDSDEDRARMQELEQRIDAQGGIEPESPDEGTRGGFGSPASIVAEARKHLGYRETGENDTKFTRWLGAIKGYKHDGFGYPWCHAFVSYCLWHSDNAGAGPRTAGCETGVAWFKQRGRFSSEPRVGSLVYYGPNGGTHVELVVGVSGGSIQTIGGNTSGSLDGKTFFNGDGVYQKTVQRTSRIFGYGHPEFSSEPRRPEAAAARRPRPRGRSSRLRRSARSASSRTPSTASGTSRRSTPTASGDRKPRRA